MAIKPILFNTEMVQAILDGRKTQTRRLVRKKYSNTDIVMHKDKYGTHFVERQNDVPLPIKHADGTMTGQLVAMCEIPWPFHRGDILWVRETWQYIEESDDDGFYIYAADRRPPANKADSMWRPSIHMPKEAARIFLRVKNVRVERLQDITDRDAESEGVSCFYHGTNMVVPETMNFVRIWNDTVKPSERERYGWEANPWVWVIEFERCEKPEGRCK